MIRPSPPEPDLPRRGLARRVYLIGAAILVLVVAIPFVTRRYSEWELVYVRAATRLVTGGHLYQPAEGYLYPPFMAWAALPFVPLPAAIARWLWLGINLACLAGLFRWAWNLAGGGPLQGGKAGPWTEHAAFLLGSLCALPHLQNCLAHQQTDVVIAALLVGGCLAWARGRALLAASAFGLAAACKCTALLWAPYLLYRGRPVAAAWVVVVAIGVNFLPDLTHPHAGGRSWVGEYAASFLRPMTRPDHVTGTWGSELIYNQSLAGAGQRWLCTGWECREDACLVHFRKDAAGPRTLRLAVYGSGLALVLIVLVVAGRPFRAPDNRAKEGNVPGAALEGGIVLLLMLLLSPMSSKAHFGVLLLPGFCLARGAFGDRQGVGTVRGSIGRRVSPPLILLGLAVGLGLVANKDLLGSRWYTLALWYGCAGWQALLLLAGCLWVLGKGRAGRAARPSLESAGKKAALPEAEPRAA